MTKMTAKSILSDYADFNIWATAALANWLSAAPAEVLEKEMPSSFSTIRFTLLHICGAEEVWLYRMNGQAPEGFRFLTDRFSGTTEEALTKWVETAKEFAAYVHGLSEAELEEVCAFRLLNGTEDARPRHQMIHHCMNHSTYHRGQIITMGRSLGLTDPPSTDYIRFIRTRNS